MIPYLITRNHAVDDGVLNGIAHIPTEHLAEHGCHRIIRELNSSTRGYQRIKPGEQTDLSDDS